MSDNLDQSVINIGAAELLVAFSQELSQEEAAELATRIYLKMRQHINKNNKNQSQEG